MNTFQSHPFLSVIIANKVALETNKGAVTLAKISYANCDSVSHSTDHNVKWKCLPH